MSICFACFFIKLFGEMATARATGAENKISFGGGILVYGQSPGIK